MAVAGAGKSCFRYVVDDGELRQVSLRQEVSTKVSNDIDELIEQLERGEVAYVSSVYPTPQRLRQAWAQRKETR